MSHKAMAPDERRHIKVFDLEGREPPAEGFVSELDVERYLVERGWKREDDWFVRGPDGDEDLIMAGPRVGLSGLVSHIALAEGRAPLSVLHDIEAGAKPGDPEAVGNG